MTRRVVYVPGLANGLAKRPDLAANISNTMEVGTYVPVFPEFPVLPSTGRRLLGPECIVITSLWETAVAKGPKDPATIEAFRAVDAQIGDLVKQGGDVYVVSDSAVFPVMAVIDIRPRLAPLEAKIEHQIAFVACGPQDVARVAQAADKGVKVIADPVTKAAYHYEGEGAVLVAPIGKSFDATKGAQGHLPMQIDDYGVLVSNVPLPAFQRRPFVRLTEVARHLRS
jgi:hypothetical protein